jgi:hypothetical protein
MEYAVTLARLSEDVAFPERLRERIRFDPVQGRLSFQGFMTKCTYDELSALTDDADYHRALEQLFVLTSEEVAPRCAKRKVPAAILVAAIGTAALVGGGLWVMSRHGPVEQPASTVPTSVISAVAR